MDTTSTKPWYYSKTIWLAIIQALIGILVIFDTQYPAVGAFTLAKSVLDVINRLLTTTAIE